MILAPSVLIVLASLPMDDMCSRIDPESWVAGLEADPERAGDVRKMYGDPGGLERLRQDIPQLQIQLEHEDPARRIDALSRIHLARSWTPPGQAADDLARPLLQRLRRETQPQVVEALVRALGYRSDTPALAPFLIELIRCGRFPDLRRAALEAATNVSDPAMLEPLVDLWKTDPDGIDRGIALRALTRLADVRALDVAIQGLREGFLEAPPLMRAIGTQKDVPTVIQIYNRPPQAPPMFRGLLLDLIADLGGPKATAFLRTEFERSDEDQKAHLADLALRAQLERGQPEWTREDQRNCVPLEEIRRKRLPYVEKETHRLLRVENTPFFRQLVPQTWRDIRGSLVEWSRHLDAPHRIEHWRRVADMLNGDPSMSASPAAEAACELARALASRASMLAPSDALAALRDVNEALALSRKAWTNDSSLAARLPEVQARVERLQRGPSMHDRGGAKPASQLEGTYPGPQGGYGSSKLILTIDGTFHLDGRSDAIDPCTWGRSTFSGTFRLEEGYVALEPGPFMASAGIDAPDLFLPVLAGGRVYLIAEPGLETFCKWEPEGKLPDLGPQSSFSRPVLAPPAGILDLKTACRDQDAMRE